MNDERELPSLSGKWKTTNKQRRVGLHGGRVLKLGVKTVATLIVVAASVVPSSVRKDSHPEGARSTASERKSGPGVLRPCLVNRFFYGERSPKNFVEQKCDQSLNLKQAFSRSGVLRASCSSSMKVTHCLTAVPVSDWSPVRPASRHNHDGVHHTRHRCFWTRKELVSAASPAMMSCNANEQPFCRKLHDGVAVVTQASGRKTNRASNITRVL